MAADPRRQRLALGVLLVAFALVLWWQFGPIGAPPGSSAGPTRPTPAGRQPAVTPAETLAAGVALDRLGRMPTLPIDSGRDPFVRGAGRRTGGTDGTGGGAPLAITPSPSAPVGPLPPAGPPPPPPITVKFIGVVERGDIGTFAVLSDGRNVYYGREGEIVDGRWRLVRIGEESIQIEYADGRGRQTVRLTG